MLVTVERTIGWDRVLDSARITTGKEPLKKEPNEDFKRKMLVSEHSPIRKLLYEVTWENISYWVAMHLRTHHVGFKSSDDDLFFIETQRSDRTQRDRSELKQTAFVTLRAQINAQAIINVSRVRLCRQASKETILVWTAMLNELYKIEPLLFQVCVPNCIYRGGFCPELFSTCGYNQSESCIDKMRNYQSLFYGNNLQNNKSK